MSRRDVLAELAVARVSAPPELRARVRSIAAAGAPSSQRRWRTWRRPLFVLSLVAIAAVAAGVVVATRPSHPASHSQHGALAFRAAARPQSTPALAVPPSAKRVERYGASLTLRVGGAHALSVGVQKAMRIAGSLSGHVVSAHVTDGVAHLVLSVPRTHVQQALARLSRLGTIVGEQVDVQDAQAGINATDRTIARLQAQLRRLRARPSTPATKREIAALTARVAALQRSRASTIRKDHFATIRLALRTPAPATASHGPLHGLLVAFRWIGIGLVYALALGVPAALVCWLVWLAARAVRRRRIDGLLSRP